MKREDLKALELSDEAIDAVMKLHGKDIEDHKAKLAETDQSIKSKAMIIMVYQGKILIARNCIKKKRFGLPRSISKTAR